MSTKEKYYTSSKLSGFSGVPDTLLRMLCPSGTIEPETVTVTVKCQGGTNPQRVRGTLPPRGRAMRKLILCRSVPKFPL